MSQQILVGLSLLSIKNVIAQYLQLYCRGLLARGKIDNDN